MRALLLPEVPSCVARSAHQVQPLRATNLPIVRTQLGCCADKTQNITDIFKNTIDIFTNTIEIFRNFNDILSFLRASAEYFLRIDRLSSAHRLCFWPAVGVSALRDGWRGGVAGL
jgi:hypothetical protein